MNESSLRVAVIGAGLAGLSCAQALQAGGLGVAVFDKSRGVSGRMSTRRGEGWQADHGAQYFTAREPAFVREVERWVAAGVAAPWSPRLAVLGGDRAASDSGRDPLDTGDARIRRHVGVPRMTSPAQWLADQIAQPAGGLQPASVALNHTVQRLVPEGGGWRLHTAEHGLLPEVFSSVMLAVPSPQAGPLLADVAPELAARAEAVTMRGCWALMLRFDEAVDLPFDAAFVNSGPLRWLARDSSKPSRPGASSGETWVLHASAEWSEANIELTPEQATDALLTAFGQWGGPRPSMATAHRWRYADSLPLADASASAWWRAPSAQGPGLGVCGDWVRAGRVEGAWSSGRALAQRLLAEREALR